MRCLPLFALLFVASTPAAQPVWLWPPEGTPEPFTTSVSTAYLASIGTTVGLVGTGLLITRLDPALSRGEEASRAELVGGTIAVLGVLFGPSAGNVVLLGRFDPSGGRGAALRANGLSAGVLGVIIGAGCVLGNMGGTAPECNAPMYVGAWIAVLGLVGGTVYDLAVIPHNAARAREAVATRRATLAPSGRGLALRVPL